MTGEYKEKQIRFCFTIFGRNNTENYRYIKNLKSVLMQNYSNYHIVFMDDVSDDDTLEQSMEYLRKLDFPKDRVTFVRNK
jgi:glycosyltransferase involved in cell wall biosynthesis